MRRRRTCQGGETGRSPPGPLWLGNPPEQPERDAAAGPTSQQRGEAAAFVLDRDGWIIDWNATAESLFGYRPGEALGRHVSCLYSAEALRCGQPRCALREAREAGCASSDEWLQRRDGTRFPVRLFVLPIHDASGELARFVHLVWDAGQREYVEAPLVEQELEERGQIRRALQEGLNQDLAGIRMLTSELKKSLARETDTTAELDKADVLLSWISEIQSHLRDLLPVVDPVDADPQGLRVALQRLMFETEASSGIACRFQCGTDLAVDEHRTAVWLYRVAEEAVGNAVRHPQAARIGVSLNKHGERLALRVCDDGRGSAAGGQADDELRLMRTYARLIGASLQIQSTTEGGTLVICALPTAEVGAS